MGGVGSGGRRSTSGATDSSKVDKTFNKRVIQFNRHVMAFGEVQFTPEGIRNRFSDYLDACEDFGMKPTVTGVAMAMGMDRRRFWEIASGNKASWHGQRINSETVDSCKRIYDFLESVLESYLSDEARNPAKWIFIAKNHFGYTDTREQLVRQVPDRAPRLSAAEVAARLGFAPEELPQAEIVQVEEIEADA